jgi:phosphate acyltransferase
VEFRSDNITRKVIAVDAMGSDKGPAEVVAAVKIALDDFSSIDEIVLLGDELLLSSLVSEAGLVLGRRLRIFHAPEVIGMDEKPIASLRQKKNSSLLRGIELVKQGDAALLLSCGNTGSLMAGGTLRLRPMEGVERPALASIWPGRGHHFVLLDAGANPEAKALHLVHQAVLGSQYCRIALGIAQPRVGLLTIGVEEGKGNEIVQQAHEMLKQLDGLIHYIGRVEGFDVFEHQADVIVCDGFVGNILLKTCHAMLRMMRNVLTEELKRTWIRKIGAALSLQAFRSVKKQFDTNRYSGAPLLGLRGHVIKAHGSSDRQAIVGALKVAIEILEHDMYAWCLRDIKAANMRLGLHPEQKEIVEETASENV